MNASIVRIKENKCKKNGIRPQTLIKKFLVISSFFVALNVEHGVMMCAGGPALPGGGGQEDGGHHQVHPGTAHQRQG
jgi:hypothetical protein